MELKKISISILALFIVTNVLAQETYQIFPSEGFKVICGCKLYVNSVFIQAAKQQGVNNILAAYICAENQDSPESGVVVNINIYDETKSFKNIQPSGYAFFEKKYLEQYAKGLSNAGFSYKYTSYQGVSALEYNFDQQGLPTKAIMFIKDKKSYLIQTATQQGLTAKYAELKNSFVILK